MRWSMAYEGAPIPFVGPMLEALLGSGVDPGGVMSPQLYNVFGAMHGTIMVFMGIVPAAFAATGAELAQRRALLRQRGPRLTNN